jgi:glucose-1-phosphate cytidylyltransferase
MKGMQNISVMILAGGMGTRLREETDTKPKPMIEIGGQPILFHLIDQYVLHGATEFIILGGYKFEFILNYMKNQPLIQRDIQSDNLKFKMKRVGVDISVTVVDTLLESNTCERINMARNLISGQTFAVSYGDSIANVNFTKEVNFHLNHKKLVTVTAVRPRSRFGRLEIDGNGNVIKFDEKPIMNEWVNGGFFLFELQAFELLRDFESLEVEALPFLSSIGQLVAFMHNDFWQPMDTFREYKILSNMWEKNEGRFW